MKKEKIILGCLAVLLPGLFATDILTGSADISLREVWYALWGQATDEQTVLIVNRIRLPKAITAMLAGTAVSVSGLLMQTLFRNPLAGPYVLGISSGASLGAAVCVLGVSSGVLLQSNHILETVGVAGAALVGAAAVLLAISAATRKIGDNTVILILGMMLGAGIDAVVQVLQFLSDEQSLKSYIVWTMGSLGYATGPRLAILACATAAGTAISLMSCKNLNLLLLGETYAATCGADIRKTRGLIFTATILLAGTVTAFCGPIGFIGLAVPHLTRLIIRNADHRVLLPGTAICGACVMLGCDIVAKYSAIPINAVTSLTGIPVVVWVVLRSRRRL